MYALPRLLLFSLFFKSIFKTYSLLTTKASFSCDPQNNFWRDASGRVLGCMWVTQKATHKARVSRTEVIGHLVSCWGHFHHFCMQTDVWVNGRSYVKKILNLCPYHYFLPTSLQREKEGLLSPDSVGLIPSRLIPPSLHQEALSTQTTVSTLSSFPSLPPPTQWLQHGFL